MCSTCVTPCARAGRALDRQRQLDFCSVVQLRELGRRRGPRRRAAPNSSGRPGVLVRVGHRRGLARGGGQLRDAALAEVGAVGVAGRGRRAKARTPTPRPPASRQALDLALVDADLAALGLARLGLGVARAPAASAASTAPARGRPPGPAGRSRRRAADGELRGSARAAGRRPPAPAGRPCRRSPWRCARSAATPSIAASASSPLPISVAPRTGCGDLAVLDQVALRDAEDEVAGGGLHLAAAEGDRVEARGRCPRSGRPAWRRPGAK